jgi:alkylhydroperoxidase family enzyme
MKHTERRWGTPGLAAINRHSDESTLCIETKRRRRHGRGTGANATKHYDEDQLAALVCLIALINTFNRGNVILQQPAGDYQPGQFA